MGRESLPGRPLSRPRGAQGDTAPRSACPHTPPADRARLLRPGLDRMSVVTHRPGRILLVDSSAASLNVLASRLRMQGYEVTECTSGAEGARCALSDPPRAVISDLWMSGISGVQLCRLLKAEPATTSVPVILRGPDAQRNRFWAERAGADAYVVKGRMGDLVRALSAAIAACPETDVFFTHLAGGDEAVRDRIAAHLDQALFESIIAAEVRALGACGSFERMFDLFSQFVCQVTSYRWLALTTYHPRRLGAHCNPNRVEQSLRELAELIHLDEVTHRLLVEDDDAFEDVSGSEPLIQAIELGTTQLGQLVLAGREGSHAQDQNLVSVLARELAGPIRMVTLVEESQALSRIDPLTGLMNRRAFREQLELEVVRSRRHGTPLSCLLFDIDHFKDVNDQHGHAVGDCVLTAMGKLLRRVARQSDVNCRWGGEEFVVALHHCDIEGALKAAERLRHEIEVLVVTSEDGQTLSVTASIGVAEFAEQDTLDKLIDRADRAMYEAKTSGRNRVRAVVQGQSNPIRETEVNPTAQLPALAHMGE